MNVLRTDRRGAPAERRRPYAHPPLAWLLPLCGAALVGACTGGEFTAATDGTSSATGTTTTTGATTTGGGGGGGAGGASATGTASVGTTATGTGGQGGAFECPAVMGGDVVPGEIEPNDDMSHANAIAGGIKATLGAICPADDTDVFSIGAPGGGSLYVSLTDPGSACPEGHFTIRVFTSASVQLAVATANGCLDLNPALYPALGNLADGTYHVALTRAEPMPSAPYQVAIRADEPSCGDAIVQTGEECDDGNTNDLDGCSASCEDET